MLWDILNFGCQFGYWLGDFFNIKTSKFYGSISTWHHSSCSCMCIWSQGAYYNAVDFFEGSMQKNTRPMRKMCFLIAWAIARWVSWLREYHQYLQKSEIFYFLDRVNFFFWDKLFFNRVDLYEYSLIFSIRLSQFSTFLGWNILTITNWYIGIGHDALKFLLKFMKFKKHLVVLLVPFLGRQFAIFLQSSWRLSLIWKILPNQTWILNSKQKEAVIFPLWVDGLIVF